MRTLLTLLLLLAWCPLTTNAAEPAPVSLSASTPITAADLQADVELLQRAYGLLHPGLQRYNTPVQMQAHFDRLRKSLDHEQSLADAFVAFSRLTAAVQCGHTYPNFYNQPKAIQQALFEQGNARVPFQFRWLGGNMVVTRDLTADGVLPRGTVVQSLDGVPTGEVLSALMQVTRADGGNDDKRRSLLQIQGIDGYETFDLYLSLLFPQIDGTQSLRVRLPEAASDSDVVVAGLTHAQRTASRQQRADDETAGWSLDTTSPGLAILRMPSWGLYDSTWDWKAFLQQSFAQMDQAGTQALVIDLRGNEGGLDVGEEILPHLIATEFSLPKSAKRVRYRSVPEDLLPVLDTWDPSFKDWGEAAKPFDERYYTLTRWEKDAPVTTLQPRTPRFNGRVFVLVGADNSSATFQFAQQMQQSGLGTLVGQPTGGNQRGINGGGFFFLRLPHSGIELDLPLIATFPPGDPPDAGLQPDVVVNPTVADITAGRDSEMQAVRALLDQGKRD